MSQAHVFPIRLFTVVTGLMLAACGQGLGTDENLQPGTAEIDHSPNDPSDNATPKDASDSVFAYQALGKDHLNPGEELLRGDWITSRDGRFIFVLQDDGNLVLYGPWGALWASNTGGRAVRTAIMQADGNLVLYGYDNKAVWHSGTYGQPNSWLVVQSDGNVVISRSGAIWASKTVVYPGALPVYDPDVRDRLHAGQELLRGQNLRSTNGYFTLWMQDDGNLVLYGPRGALWASSTSGHAVRTAIMQGDANLVLYGYDNRPVWASNTRGRHNPTLVLQNDGNLVIYATWAIWATGTGGH